jgi:hypothetical protein
MVCNGNISDTLGAPQVASAKQRELMRAVTIFGTLQLLYQCYSKNIYKTVCSTLKEQNNKQSVAVYDQ